MVKLNGFQTCTRCQGDLKLKVRFCPFCGKPQNEEENKPQSVPQVEEPIDRVELPIEQPKVEQTPLPEPIKPSIVVRHLTQKTNKELLGIIIKGTSLEAMKAYDPYAFKKEGGIFVRLKHLNKIPNDYLSIDQYELKLHQNFSDTNIDVEAWDEQPNTTSVQTPNNATPPPLPVQNPLATPQPNPSNFKYVVIAFIIILGVIFLVFSGDKKEKVDTSVATPTIDHCEVANGEITHLLTEKLPVRALSIVKLNQDECKTNSDFVQLVVSVEAQATSAKEKISLAKEYAQAGNLTLAHETVSAALDLDAEVTGGNDLLQSLQEMIEQQNNAAVEEPAMEEAPVDSIANEINAQQAAEQAAAQANQKAQLDQQAAALSRQQAQADAQAKQRIQADQQAQIEKENARKQAAVRAQSEERFTNQLSRAERALQSNNYALAKSIARDVLSSSSNNAEAKRILRQAEQGESKAFDEMVIE